MDAASALRSESRVSLEQSGPHHPKRVIASIRSITSGMRPCEPASGARWPLSASANLRFLHELTQRVREIAPNVRRGRAALHHQLGSTNDYREDVFEIAAAVEVALPSLSEGLELSRHKERSCDQTNFGPFS